MTLELRVVEKVSRIPASAWDALVRDDASPFVEHAWLACLEEAGCVGGESGWYPHHLVLYDGEELVAAAPAYLKTNSEGEFVFDWGWASVASQLEIAYYPKLVVAVPFTPATGDRLLCHPSRDRRETVAVFARALQTLCRELELSSAHVLFPSRSEADLWAEAGMLLRSGVQYQWHNRGFSTFEDFLATLPQKRRTQIRRERKQPARDGITITTLGPEELAAGGSALSRRMYALYLTTVDKYYYGRRYLKPAFFELVRERFADRLAWAVARDAEGTIVASAFNVRKGRMLYGRYWGVDAEKELPFLHFNVCFYHGIEEAIRGGLSAFNPGAGGEHKRVRGFVPTETFSAHHIEDARLRTILEDFMRREQQKIAAYVASNGEGKDDIDPH